MLYRYLPSQVPQPLNLCRVVCLCLLLAPSSVVSGMSFNEDMGSAASTSSVGPRSVSPLAGPSGMKKFVLPDSWRPSIMHAIKASTEAEKRKRLTPDVRNEIVRDVVSTMYAYMSQPNKEFCTQVAEQLMEKYSFMRDVGTNVTGYVSFYVQSYCYNVVVM